MFLAALVLLGAGLITGALDVSEAGDWATPAEAAMWGAAGVLFARTFASSTLAVGVAFVVAFVELSTGGPGAVSAPSAPGDPLVLGLPLGGRIEVTEAVFGAAFWWWAGRFGIRRVLTRLALLIALGVAVATALPGTALLAAAFVGPNLDRLPAVLAAPEEEPSRRWWQRD